MEHKSSMTADDADGIRAEAEEGEPLFAAQLRRANFKEKFAPEELAPVAHGNELE